MLGRLCHGKPRGAREPLSIWAPLARMIAWALLSVAALLLLLAIGALFAEDYVRLSPRIAPALTLSGGLATLFAVVIRAFAMGFRATDLTRAAVEREGG